MSGRTLKMKSALCAVTMLLAVTLCEAVRADVVMGWNRNAQQALLRANVSPVVSTRDLAIVQVAVFDAVNGSGRRYAPIHVEFAAPPGASRQAAAVSPAAAVMLSTYFGDDAGFLLTSETLPGVVRSYASFTQTVDEAFDARIYGGIHFRSACRDGRAPGTQVGSFILANVARSLHGKRKG